MTTTRFEDMTVKELIALCKEKEIFGYSASLKKGKAELIYFIANEFVSMGLASRAEDAVPVSTGEVVVPGAERVGAGGVEGPMLIGTKIKVFLANSSIDGLLGKLLYVAPNMMARLITESLGEIWLPLHILRPAENEPSVPGSGGEVPVSEADGSVEFKVGDFVVVEGYLLDGEEAIVLESSNNHCSIACLRDGRCFSIPNWALIKKHEAPESLTPSQEATIHFTLRQPIIRDWMAACAAEIKDGLPIFSFENHHNLQLVNDATKESPFIYMGLFWDGDKAGWVGLWLSEDKSFYFSGDFEKARQIFDEIKALYWDFNTLQDISTDTLLKYQQIDWEKATFRRDDIGMEMVIFDFEDDRMSHKSNWRHNSYNIIDIDLFYDNHNNQAFLPVMINEEKAVLATGTKSEMDTLYKSLFNLLTLGREQSC